MNWQCFFGIHDWDSWIWNPELGYSTKVCTRCGKIVVQNHE